MGLQPLAVDTRSATYGQESEPATVFGVFEPQRGGGMTAQGIALGIWVTKCMGSPNGAALMFGLI
jgi:hypothetical protein